MRREFKREGLGYVLRVPGLMTELTVDRLTRSRGETHGELTVLCGLPGNRSADGHIHQARFNLTSTTARTSVAKVLERRRQRPGGRLARSRRESGSGASWSSPWWS